MNDRLEQVLRVLVTRMDDLGSQNDDSIGGRVSLDADRIIDLTFESHSICFRSSWSGEKLPSE